MPYFEVNWGGARRVPMDAPFPEGFAQPLQMAYILIGKGWHGGYFPEGMKRASDRCECTTPGRFRGRMSGVNFNVVNRTLIESLIEEQPVDNMDDLRHYYPVAQPPTTYVQQGQAQAVSLQQLERMYTATQRAASPIQHVRAAELAAPAEGRPLEWVDNRLRGR